MERTPRHRGRINHSWRFPLCLVAVAVVGCSGQQRARPGEEDSGIQHEDTDFPSAFFGFVGDGWGSAPGYGLSWVSQIKTTASESWWDGNGIFSTAFAGNGDVLACGELEDGWIVFGSGTGNEIAFDSGERGRLFLARFEADGTPIWVSTVRAGFPGECWDLEAMDDGSVLMAGRVQFHSASPTVFGAGEPGETVIEACSDSCPFIAKYESDGSFDWVSNAMGGGHGVFASMAVAPDGDICVSGTFSNGLVFDDGTPAGTTIDASPGHDGLLARFDGSGTFRWARVADSTNFGNSRGVAALPDGSCAALFMHAGNTELDTGYSDPFEVLAGGYWSLMVANYFDNGNLAWVNDLGIVGGLQAFDTLSLSAGIAAVGGDLLVGSGFSGTLQAGTEHDPVLVEAGETLEDLGFFLARLSGKDGARLWTALAMGTTNPPGQNLDWLCTVETTADDRVIVGGAFTGVKVFGVGGPNLTALKSTGQSPDAFIAAYETDGSFLWASRVVTQSEYPENYIGPDLGAWVTSVSAGESGSLFIAGGFLGEATFGLGSDDVASLESIGTNDAFLMRLDPD